MIWKLMRISHSWRCKSITFLLGLLTNLYLVLKNYSTKTLNKIQLRKLKPAPKNVLYHCKNTTPENNSTSIDLNNIIHLKVRLISFRVIKSHANCLVVVDRLGVGVVANIKYKNLNYQYSICRTGKICYLLRSVIRFNSIRKLWIFILEKNQIMKQFTNAKM